MPPDMDYWSRVFAAVERQAPDLGLRFVATWNWQDVEITGPDVVVVNLGAEPPFRPLYSKSVLATFRSVAWKPGDTVSGMTRFDMMTLSGVIKLIYNTARHWKGEASIKGDLPGDCFDVPLGVYKWEEATPKPMAERAIDLVFLGNVELQLSGFRRNLAPKTTGRNDMIKAIEYLQKKRPELKMQIGFADSFGADVPGLTRPYTEILADSKLGLHPIGRNPESFRFFELVRMGCIPVSHLLPERRHYEGNPAVYMDRFDKLEGWIDKLLGDPEGLQKRSDECIEYYNRLISPQAIAGFMVERIRAIQSR